MRHALSFSIACASLLFAQATSPTLAQAAAPAPRYATTRVEVDASKLEGEGSTLEKSIASLARNEVRQAVERRLGEHLTVVGEGGEAVVYVELLWRDYETSHYGVRVEIRRGASSELVAVEECKLCDEEKLARKVAGRVPELLPLLVEEARAAEVNASPEPEPEVEAEPETTEPDRSAHGEPAEDARRPRPLGPLGISGAVVGIGGLAGVVYGSVLLSRGTTVRLDDDDESFVAEESYTRPGGIWLGIGVSATVIGAVMVAVDLTVLRKRRAQRIEVRPEVGAALTGATLRIRF